MVAAGYHVRDQKSSKLSMHTTRIIDHKNVWTLRKDFQQLTEMGSGSPIYPSDDVSWSFGYHCCASYWAKSNWARYEDWSGRQHSATDGRTLYWQSLDIDWSRRRIWARATWDFFNRRQPSLCFWKRTCSVRPYLLDLWRNSEMENYASAEIHTYFNIKGNQVIKGSDNLK